jgi:hypothetical protein
MNKTISFAAIAMVAVIMGMSAFAPAMAVPKGNSGAADTEVCHYFAVYLDEEETELDLELSAWGILYVNSQGQLNGHMNHGDMEIGDGTEGTITDGDCLDPEKPAPEL